MVGDGVDEVVVQHLQIVEAAAGVAVRQLPAHLVDQVVVPRERAGEDDAGLVLEWRGQFPILGQVAARGGLEVGALQRDAGIAQSFQAGGERVLARLVEDGSEVAVDAPGGQVEAAAAGG